LKIGYVSADFRDHVVGRNVLTLLGQHDREDFEVWCYSGAIPPDSMTAQFHTLAGGWRDVVGLSVEKLARLIRNDGIDILVDLALHAAGNQLPVFARKPAPVQVSFAGYPGNTGLSTIEYHISDRHLEAKAVRDRKENAFLIDSFWCYDPCGARVEVNELPAHQAGTITFGCLNNFCKINEPVLKLWARVLRATSDSRLVMLTGLGSHRQRTLAFLKQQGIDNHRIDFYEPCPREKYLQLYHQLDIVLDTFPYNGHTTSLDALWMGVPVVSLAGERTVSRGGLSQLSNLGFSELVAFTEDDFVQIATLLANDLSRLTDFRRTLRARMAGSVLMDARQFARDIESAYRRMWQQWCAKQTGV
jgi:predicted O-linked N-acetylglucosamine transferase (SPINDLY family)